VTPTPTRPDNRTWTMLLYCRVSPDLTAACDADLQEMAAGLASPDSKPDDSAHPRLVSYVERLDPEDASRSMPELRIGAARTPTRPLDLSALLARYGGGPGRLAVVLWGHGSGWAPPRSTAGDRRRPGFTRLPDSDSQVLDVVTTARLLRSTGVGLLGYDACEMGCLEVAYEFAASGGPDRFVASELPEPASGWDYRAILSRLTADPTIAPADLADVIVASYAASLATEPGLPRTADGRLPFLLGAVEPAPVRDVVPAVRAFAKRLEDELRRERASAMDRIVAAAAMSSVEGAGSAVDLARFGEALDEPELARRLRGLVRPPSAGMDGSDVPGLSVYLPDPEGPPDPRYSRLAFARDCGWGSFVQLYQAGTGAR
jgi:hypothetical protein